MHNAKLNLSRYSNIATCNHLLNISCSSWTNASQLKSRSFNSNLPYLTNYSQYATSQVPCPVVNCKVATTSIPIGVNCPSTSALVTSSRIGDGYYEETRMADCNQEGQPASRQAKSPTWSVRTRHLPIQNLSVGGDIGGRR